MKIAIIASVLVLLMGGAARAQLIPCETYGPSSAHAPQFVLDYLKYSKDFYVRACPDGDHPRYLGGSSVSKEGDICRYSLSELNFVGSKPPHLEHVAIPSQTFLLVSKSSCPSPIMTDYAATNGISRDIFEHLVHTWKSASSSLGSFDNTFRSLSNADRSSAWFLHLRAQVARGNIASLRIQSVITMHDLGVWTEYEIDIADSIDLSRAYVIYVTRWFGRFYMISGIGVATY